MRESTITCDVCSKDLTATGNAVDYRVALHNERIPSVGGSVTALMMYPILNRDYDFCSLKCLASKVTEMAARDTQG